MFGYRTSTYSWTHALFVTNTAWSLVGFSHLWMAGLWTLYKTYDRVTDGAWAYYSCITCLWHFLWFLCSIIGMVLVPLKSRMRTLAVFTLVSEVSIWDLGIISSGATWYYPNSFHRKNKKVYLADFCVFLIKCSRGEHVACCLIPIVLSVDYECFQSARAPQNGWSLLRGHNYKRLQRFMNHNIDFFAQYY